MIALFVARHWLAILLAGLVASAALGVVALRHQLHEANVRAESLATQLADQKTLTIQANAAKVSLNDYAQKIQVVDAAIPAVIARVQRVCSPATVNSRGVQPSALGVNGSARSDADFSNDIAADLQNCAVSIATLAALQSFDATRAKALEVTP